MEKQLLTREQLISVKDGGDIHALDNGMLRTSVVDTTEKEFDDEQQVIQHFITTESLDRHGDVVRASGGQMENFAKNPVVLYGHDYYGFPVGKSLWQKTKTKAGVKGVLAATQFAKTPEGTLCYQLWKDGFLNAASIGFIPLEYEVMRGPEDETGYKPIVGLEFTKWELLEYSIVPVPANAEALRLAISKAESVDQSVREKLIESIEKGVIRYKKYPLADEGESWDGPAQVRAADVNDLKTMCTWFDDGAPDVKGSYKLPHHRQADKYTVWAGVRAAMGAVLGARGGVNIPDSDKAGCHGHLARHYKEFSKDVPPMKQYTEEELKSMFPELYKLTVEEWLEKIGETVGKLTEAVSNLTESMKAATEATSQIKSMNELMLSLNEKIDQTIGTDGDEDDESKTHKPEGAASVETLGAPTDEEFDASALIVKSVTGEVSRLTGRSE